MFQWNGDGTEFIQLGFGGKGQNDNNGAVGNSKTGGHHIIGLAEAMARRLAPDYIVAHASAHSFPIQAMEYAVVNWIRAAAIIANVDPIERGYLIRDRSGRLRLAPLRRLHTADLQADEPNQVNVLVEYVLHNLSDADSPFTDLAASKATQILQIVAHRFGYDPKDSARFNTRFRNPVLTFLSAERLQIIFANAGIDAVVTEIDKLRRLGVI